MAGRRHVVSVPLSERKSHDEISRLPTTTTTTNTNSTDSTSAHRRSSSDASPPPHPSRSLHFLSSTKDKDKESGFDLKRLPFFGEKISSFTSGGGTSSNLPQIPTVSIVTDDVPGSAATPTSTSAQTPSSSTSALTPSSAQTMASPPLASSLVQTVKGHSSPSKTATTSALTSSKGTYDAKIVQQEMHRLGSLAQFPGALAPTLGLSSAGTMAVSAAGPLSLLATGGVSLPSSQGLPGSHSHSNVAGPVLSDGGAWTRLHVLVLPLFNHEPLQYAIEDLNLLVKRHIESVVARGPARSISTLETDATELINTGMITLNAKLKGCEDEDLLVRVVGLWCFFWDQVLPYIEGVLLPLQTDQMLLSLSRTKPQRPSSPQDTSPTVSTPTTSSPIDVRMLALRAFRDRIIFPVAQRLEARLIALARRDSVTSGAFGNGVVVDSETYQQPRLQQMLLVLHSQAQRARSALSLTAPPPTPSPQELAIRKLLDALTMTRSPSLLSGPRPFVDQNRPLPASPRTPASPANGNSNKSTPVKANLNGNGLFVSPSRARVPTFLSGGAPRDRRGRVAGKARAANMSAKRKGRILADDLSTADEEGSAYGDGGDLEGDGGETPRNGFSREWERDRKFLESLRSPVVDDGAPEVAGQIVGWNVGSAEYNSADSDEEELGWDHHQAVVERMVGITNGVNWNGNATSALAEDGDPLTPSQPQARRRRRMT